ncbi:MAG: hypothetical protein ACJZ4O_04415 [Pelagibacteraceae bacterium]
MQINIIYRILYIILSFSLLIGFYFGEDSSGSGGFINDFRNTWPLVINPFDEGLISRLDFKFPLHYYLMFSLNNIIKDQYTLRALFCIASISVPFLFYLCLKNKFHNINKNNTFLFSLIIFLLPSFRSGAIWANTQITALIFFLLSLLFFLKNINKQNKNIINFNLVMSLIFLSLAVYSRQLYALVFLYYVFYFYRNLNLKFFIIVCAIIFLFSIPGLIFVTQHPRILTTTVDNTFYNSLLINCSILSFYLLPFYFTLIFFKKLKLKEIFSGNLNNVIVLVLISLIFLYFFNYNYKLGGGFFLKLSVILFDNLYLFYLSSLAGVILLSSLAKEKIDNLVIIFLLLFGFTSYAIFQKYFEPMFIILLFILFQTEKTKFLLDNKKTIFTYQLYFFIYLLSAIINDVYQITKNLN